MVTPNYQLTMRSGPTPGKTYLLEKEETLVGRDLANDIAVGDAEVSRRHAHFFVRESNIFVEDLGSTNGTFLNGERISTPQQLRVGDVITFGENIVMVFEKASLDIDATFIAPHEPEVFEEPKAAPEVYPQTAAPVEYRPQQTPLPEEPVYPSQPAPVMPEKKQKRKLPTWLMILIIAIVVLACVIAVTLYFMPASWWCAITFDMLEGCPIY